MQSDTLYPAPTTPESAVPPGGLQQRAIPVLEQYWHAIRNHLTAISAIVLACVIAGLIITLLMTPQFTATSRVEINRNQDNVTNVESVEGEDAGKSLEFYQTQYSLLEARSLAERVVRTLNLTTDADFFDMYGLDPENDGLFRSGESEPNSSSERNRRLRLAAKVLLENVTISPIRGSSLVDIQYTSPNRYFSAKVANAWVDEFIDSTLDRRFASTTDARKFLEERLAQLRARLEESERRLVRYASNKAIVSLASNQDEDGRTTTQRTLVSTDLEALNSALSVATAARLAAESEARQSGSASKGTLSNQAINGMRQKRAEIASEHARLLSQFEPEYPTVVALASQIQDLDSSIEEEESRVRTAANTEYRRALQLEKELLEEVEQLKGQFIEQSRDNIQYNIYQREVDTNRELYDGLLQRYKEIGVAGVGNNNIAVVDRAQPPEKQSSPVLILNLGLALIAGFGLAGGYVFAREQIDQSLKDPADVEEMLGLSAIGIVPHIDSDNVLESLSDRKSIASEAYFSIGTNLSFLTEHGTPKSMLLTSTRPNEGKSTSAFSIAQILARGNKKILLIDADLRNPSIHHLLKNSDVSSTNDCGLSNYLSGEDHLEKLIKKSDDLGISFMFAGPIPPNAAELLSGDRAGNLLQILQQQYDHVIVDAPPVLGLADIPLLAGTVEGLIYTVEANGAKIRAIQSALRRLRAANANIFGVILTKLDDRNRSYGYGYGYGYGYEYGHSPSADESK